MFSNDGDSNGSSSDDVEREAHCAPVHYNMRKKSREMRHKMERLARFIEEDEDYWSDSEPKRAKRKSYVRISATKRERTRMHKLNSAYDKLRKAVPKLNCDGSNQRLSKIDTLRLAIDYICALTKWLGKLDQDDKHGRREDSEGTTSSAEEDDADIIAKLIESVIEDGGWFLGKCIGVHFKIYMFGVVGEIHAHDCFEVISFYNSYNYIYSPICHYNNNKHLFNHDSLRTA